MEKYLQDHAWSILPKEFKEEVKKEYKVCSDVYRIVSDDAVRGCYRELEDLFGRHNLTSDSEGEDEILCVSRKEIQQLVEANDVVILEAAGIDNIETIQAKTVNTILNRLFGSKCLPDEDAHEDNFARFEPKPAEPKNKDCDNHLADVGKMMDRRLNIAAMAMQGILSNADRMKVYEYVATEPPCEELAVVVARNALRYADALIAAVKEGGSHD